MGAEIVVPSHGPMGDAAVIGAYDDYFTTLQPRARELKSQSRCANTSAELLTRELAPRYADWSDEGIEIIATSPRGGDAEML